MRRVRCEWYEMRNKPEAEAEGRLERVAHPRTMLAWFHTWGFDYEEFDSGPGNFTVAIVEDSHGKVHTFPANQITFLDKE